jgi:NAD(P)-dependent dehydrogenase (short-subunit alcohol dehydrogenase family)
MNVALVTGGSAGLGRAVVAELTHRGWHVITDARRPERLEALATDLPHPDRITMVPGDVTDAAHRAALRDEVDRAGRLDLLLNNASLLGPVTGRRRFRRLADVTTDDLQLLWRTNVEAPLLLTGALLPRLTGSTGILLSVSSDAAVDHYPGWGLYSASKAALDHLTLTYGAENPEISAYAVDPGDMRTEMHQEWFPDDDISDRPLPETIAPRLLSLVARRPANGRYRAADFPAATPIGA